MIDASTQRSSIIGLAGVFIATALALSTLTKEEKQEMTEIELSIRTASQNLRTAVLTPSFLASAETRAFRENDDHLRLGEQLYKLAAQYEWLTGESVTTQLFPLYVDEFLPNIPFWLAGHKYVEYPMSRNPSAEVGKYEDCEQLFLVSDCTAIDKSNTLLKITRDAKQLALATNI
ncbi:hypothetical protein [Agarilytica rhodophyticola]|uniref:hypothetical protein n=1 Tax=Agarilytica rhodophyticola TaxID=1737490 RepID=UPI000CD83336|nr:hypothetical protein [Agarilytica rhodophyticola]